MSPRKIHFKAYGQKKKELLPVKFIDEDDIPYDFNGEPIEDPLIFESTGILDKDLRQIYNGDILTIYDKSGNVLYTKKPVYYSELQGQYAILTVADFASLIALGYTFKITGHVAL